MSDVDNQQVKSLERRVNMRSYQSFFKALEGLPEFKRVRLTDRASILSAQASYQAHHADKEEAIRCLVFDFKRQAIRCKLPEGIYERVGSLSRSTLYRWEKTLREGGWVALVDNYESPKKSYLEQYPDMAIYLKMLLERFPEAAEREISDCLSSEAVIKEWPQPTRGTIYKHIRIMRKQSYKQNG